MVNCADRGQSRSPTLAESSGGSRRVEALVRAKGCPALFFQRFSLDFGKVFRNVSFTQKNGPPFPKGGPFLTLSHRNEYQCLSFCARPSAKALSIWSISPLPARF